MNGRKEVICEYNKLRYGWYLYKGLFNCFVLVKNINEVLRK